MQLSQNANPKGLSHHNLSVTEHVGSQSHEHWDSMSILLHHWAFLSPCLYSVVENLTWTIQAGLFLLVQSHIFCLNSPIPGPLLPDWPWTGCGDEGGSRHGRPPGLWRALSPSSAVASCLGDAAWVLRSSSFPSCLLMMHTNPACPGTGRSKRHLCHKHRSFQLSLHSLILPVPPWRLRTSQLFTQNHVRCQDAVNCPEYIFPDTSFTLTLHSWGPGKKVSASPFLLVSNLSEISSTMCHPPTTSSGMVRRGSFTMGLRSLALSPCSLPHFSGNHYNQKWSWSPLRVM